MKKIELPLCTLLSQVLVAFTIEFDNEFEHQMPHRTTNHGSTNPSGPWLVSLVMWSNCMRFVGEQGVTVGELEALARTPTNLNGMQRWGYVVVAPDPADKRPKPPRRDWLIHATSRGRQAQQVWRPLFGGIEKRWEKRVGKREIDSLRQALETVATQIKTDLPDCLPILGYGLHGKVSTRKPGERSPADGSLPALIARALLEFALEFEGKSSLSSQSAPTSYACSMRMACRSAIFPG